MTDHDTLHAALAAVQADLPHVGTDQTAQVETRGGGSYSYSYASLADVNRAVLPVLAAHGLTWTCVPVVDDQPRLIGSLTHAPSGEQLEPRAVWALPRTADPQALGSAITYGRRYLLTAVVGIAPDDDDDGATAKRAADRRADRAESEAVELMQAAQLLDRWVPDAHRSALLDAYQPGAANLRDLHREQLARLVRALSSPDTRQRVLDGAAAAAEADDDDEDGGGGDADAVQLVHDRYGDLTVVQVDQLVRHGRVEYQHDGRTVRLDLSDWDVPDRAGLVRELEGDQPRRTVSALVAAVTDPDPGDDPATVRIPRDG